MPNRQTPTRRELQFFRDFPWFSAWANHDPTASTPTTLNSMRLEIEQDRKGLKPQDHIHAVHDLATASYIGYMEGEISPEEAVFQTHEAVLDLPPLSDQLVKKTHLHGESILRLSSAFADAHAQNPKNLPVPGTGLYDIAKQPANGRNLSVLARGLNRLSWAFRRRELVTEHICAHPSRDAEDTFVFTAKDGTQRVVTGSQVITPESARRAAEVLGLTHAT